MDEFYNSTRECMVFDQLQPEIVAAIRAYLTQQELGHLEHEILCCCETTSTRKKVSLFSRMLGSSDKVIHTGMMVTPGWLIWVRSGKKAGPALSVAKLSEIEVQKVDPALRAAYPGLYDDCLTIFGFFNRMSRRGTVHIALGKEPAAQKFRDVLKDAVAKAHP